MMTLVTGTPGSGKTLLVVSMLEAYAKEGRRIWVDGIRGLLVDHTAVDEPWMRRWWEHVGPNDVIVVDEVQRLWPPMSVSVKPSEDIEKLHVHRHFGVDIIVITQHPNRMSKVVRDLIGRHVHVRRMFGMARAMLYEWDSARNPQGSLKDAVKRPWKYPRHVYDLYVSAEMHTKPKAVVPKALFVIPVAAVAAAFLLWKGYGSVMGMGKPKTGAGGAASGVAGASARSGASAASGAHWRVVGSYAVDGVPFVLLTDKSGWIRAVKRDGFSGNGMALEGVVDGERVAVWTATASADDSVKVGK
ncbi:zonular occludens toxin domain-containing protein [Paraburkholderia sp. BCC1885]|uniref:zonular occludens toxin domain-containing protein n=1 Tax=Paraburkholderia sp. BCC1885 TaxID=2562669 RepID=UPI001183F5F2|nr:zonular occludens toxin domain-containing protein [Paraburkholderia sp. BCC1885]